MYCKCTIFDFIKSFISFIIIIIIIFLQGWSSIVMMIFSTLIFHEVYWNQVQVVQLE